MAGITGPVRPVRDIGPGTNLRQPARQGVHLAVDIVEASDVACHPVVWQNTGVADQVTEYLFCEPRMFVGSELPEIRQLTCLPEQPHCSRRCRRRPDVG